MHLSCTSRIGFDGPKTSLAHLEIESGLFDTENGDYARLRPLLQPILSDKVLREQDPLIQANVDLVISKLQARISSSTADSLITGVVDLNTWRPCLR